MPYWKECLFALILQARLQQYMNCELSGVQAGFRKGRGTRDQMPTPAGSQKKQENSRKTSTSASLTTWNPLLDHNKLWKIIKDMQIPNHFICQQVKKQQLELDMEQQTVSK